MCVCSRVCVFQCACACGVCARACSAFVGVGVSVRARAHACAWACVRLRACFWLEVCGATEPPASNTPCCMLHRSRPVATTARAPPGTRRARLWVCAALHAMLCAAHGGRIQRRRSELPTIATESTRARCTRRYRGVLHAAWWAARPLLLRTSDLARGLGPRCSRARPGAPRCSLLGRPATAARRKPTAMAVTGRQGATGQLALGSSHHQ
jgi:hypothetical protein